MKLQNLLTRLEKHHKRKNRPFVREKLLASSQDWKPTRQTKEYSKRCWD